MDTYALPYLVEALGRVDSEADVQRIGRLAPAIARFLGPSFAVPPDADREAARRFGEPHSMKSSTAGAPEFTDLGRFERMTAHLTQTEFGVFWIQTLRELRGIDTPVVRSTLALAFASSARLLTLAALGALRPGAAFGWTLPPRFRSPCCFQCSGFECPSYEQCQLERRPTNTTLARVRVRRLAAALLSARSAARAFRIALDAAHSDPRLCLHADWRTLDGVDWRSMLVIARRPLASRLRAVGLSLATIMPTFLPLIAGEILLWVACVELSSGTDGLFPRTVRALERGDLHALLTLSLLSWTSTAPLQTLSDALFVIHRRKATVVVADILSTALSALAALLAGWKLSDRSWVVGRSRSDWPASS